MPAPVVVNARFLTQPITGTQRFAIELCRGLKQLRPDVVLLAPDRILHPDLAAELDVELSGRLKKGILWEQLELPLLLRKRGNPLLVNLCNLAPLAYGNNLVAVLDLSFHLHPEWFSPTFSRLYNFVIPRVARRARQVVTISENSRQDIVRHFGVPAARVDLVYPSVSGIFLNPPTHLPPNPYGRYVLAVSSLDPRKNFRGLIEAFKAGDFADTKLVIVGSEHKVFADTTLKELVANDPRIVFTGYLSDEELVGLYRQARGFAYPSFFEGFGIPPLEAMACGCPTLVANTTSLPEVCGEASVYVDPHDTNSIRRGLEKLLHDEALRAELIRKGYERVAHFNWQASARHLNHLLDALA